MGECVAVLRQKFGLESFRPGQEEAVSAAVQGRDVLVLMPTGGGKSVCFQVPALALPGVAKDQVDALKKLGIAASVLNSSLTMAQRRQVESDILSQPPRLKIVYVTPELMDTRNFKNLLEKLYSRKGISLFAVDEAHCISTWGHEFRPAYRNLGNLRSEFKSVPIMALTATATPKCVSKGAPS
eukprot:m51a1_g2405 putative atp-dependent dna helicase (183) ;mRNA; r:771953-772836